MSHLAERMLPLLRTLLPRLVLCELEVLAGSTQAGTSHSVFHGGLNTSPQGLPNSPGSATAGQCWGRADSLPCPRWASQGSGRKTWGCTPRTVPESGVCHQPSVPTFWWGITGRGDWIGGVAMEMGAGRFDLEEPEMRLSEDSHAWGQELRA